MQIQPTVQIQPLAQPPISIRAGLPRQIARADAAEVRDLRPESVQLSSRGLGWKVLNFERREVGPSTRDLPHGATEHLVFVSLGGGTLEREHEGRRVRHELSSGFVAVLPSGQPIRLAWSSRISFSLLALQPEFLRRVAEDELGLDPAKAGLAFAEREQDPAIATIAGALAREAVRGDAGSRVYAESLASILAVHLLRNYPTDSGQTPPEQPAQALPRAVSKAVAFIQQNQASDIGLAEIAAAAHMSPFHLAHVFKRTIGIAPYQYLIQMRVNSARSLIAAGSHSLAEVATSVGFADQSHLTRHFKRVLGVTPRQLAA